MRLLPRRPRRRIGDHERILVLSMYFPPEVGAPQTRLAAVTKALTEMGHSVEVVTAMPNYPTGKVFDRYRRRLTVSEEQGGIRIHRSWVYASMGSGARRLLSYLSFTASCVLGLVRAQRPTMVVIESPPLFLAVPGLVAARIWRATAVFNVADLWPDAAVELGALRPGLTLRGALALERWAYRESAFVNAVTDSVREVLLTEKHLPADKVVDLPNGVDVELFHPADGPVDGQTPRDLVYAGTVGYIHAAEHLVAAMQLLTDLPVRLVFYASGSMMPALEQLRADLALDNVVFRDPLPLTELAPELRSCLAGVVTLADVPMAAKTRPSKMFPVMASARPVLFCGAGEGARMVTDHGAGIVVANRAEDIAAAVRRLWSDPRGADDLGANGRRFVEGRLAWSRICAEWMAQLRSRSSS